MGHLRIADGLAFPVNFQFLERPKSIWRILEMPAEERKYNLESYSLVFKFLNKYNNENIMIFKIILMLQYHRQLANTMYLSY